MKMDPDLKKRWVEALRSGKYQQGEGQLQLGYTYCCLGVLADVMGVLTHEGVVPDGQGGEWAGSLPHDMVTGLPQETQRRLQTMNDCQNMSFCEIADHIEETL